MLPSLEKSLVDKAPGLDPEANCSLLPEIAALAFISALTIVPSKI